MGQDLSLKVVLRVQDSASGSLRGFGSVLSGLSGPAGIAVTALLAVGAAVVGIGVKAVQMAGQYQQSLLMVQALTGASQAQMASYDTQLKALAMNAGVAPNTLAQGLYNVLSAGYQGAQAMQVLTLATEDAKIGMTSSTITSNALTVALKAFNVSGKDFTAVNGEMLRTVTAGKMTMQDYASAISKTSSVAVQYKDTMSDMNAVLATLTSSGIKNANVAGTDYNQLLKVLNGNTAAVIKASEKLNPAFDGNAFAAMNVHDKVLYLNKMIVQHGHNISEVIGKQQNAAAAFTMLATHAGTYTTNLKNLSNQQQNANATQSAWAVTQSGFNQTMSRLGATVQVLLITIGQALLPTLTQIAQAALPIIQGFTTWLVKSGVLQTGLSTLSTGIKGLIGFFAGLATGIGNIIGFFQKNQVAALALLIPLGMLGAVLVNMAVTAIVAFIAAIPGLLAGFIAWATAAGAAAIATIAATWPILLIGAAIGVLIAIIVLLWTHWSQVTKFLQTAWQITVAALMVALKAVGQFFVNVWNGIVSGLRSAWAWITGIVQAGLQWLWNAFTAPFRAIGQLFVWLYNHNYYFKKLIDTIRVIIAFGVAWLKHAWQTAINWLVGLWANISGWASSSWTKLKQTIINLTVALAVWIYGQWTKVSGWLTDKWNQFSGLASKAWQAVSGVFSSIWSKYIAGPLGSLWNQLSGWFSNLAKTALQWGQNLITGFINGIKNMLGQVAQTAQNVASTVAKFLGFHSPAKEGEGRFIVQWGSNMLKGFGSGVLQAIPALQAQVAMAVKTSLQPMSPPALSSAIPYGRPPSGNTYNNSSAGGGIHNYSVSVRAETDNPKKLAQALEKEISAIQSFKFRRSGVMGNPAVGGRNS